MPKNDRTEADLADAFDAYINPASPAFCPDFTLEILHDRPDWFKHQELVDLVEWFASKAGIRRSTTKKSSRK